ncbi:MAG: hypothetical protein WBA46_04605 [Thermomicrobiales bacterium]
MVLPGIPFLSAGEIASIFKDVGRGFATQQAVQDPAPVVTIRRRDRVTGDVSAVYTDLPVIAVSIANRDAQEDGDNDGRARTDVVGEVLAWAPFDVQKDDWFIWDGQRCVIEARLPEDLGVIEARFRLEQGGRP